MATKVGALSGDGGDPRLSVSREDAIQPERSNDLSPMKEGEAVRFRPQERMLHDVNVTFEEYVYYAEKARLEEENDIDAPETTIRSIIFPSKGGGARQIAEENGEKKVINSDHLSDLSDINLHNAEARAGVSATEWTNASRALRSATAAACFYLITTDILGPFGVGFAIASMGWGQGIGLFTLFGACAGISGYLLWKVFMNVDSYEFPAKNYGDLAFRTWGSWLRYTVNFLQAIQLILSVGVIVVANGLSISQVSQFRLCYVVCCLIWAFAGFILGQIRTLNKLGWMVNFAIFLNLLIMFISMGVMAHSEPDYEAFAGSAGYALGGASVVPVNGTFPPIQRYGGVPPSTNGFVGGINGLMQGVYAYAGAQLFVEFMAEMRRPRDFLKAMWGAQFFIYACYMIYGCYTYYYFGQYSNQIAYQALGPYVWQTVCNMIGVFSGIIAATLYGNIGIKVIYNNVLVELFSAPPLQSKKGRIIWIVLVPLYWSLAFILAASIPDFFGLTTVTAAVCFVQFTYTFPAFIGMGYFVKRGAMLGEQPFDPAVGEPQRQDSGVKRFIRGYFGKYWWLNIILTIYTLGALVVSGLGAYSAIEGLIAAFQTPQITAWTCTSPLAG